MRLRAYRKVTLVGLGATLALSAPSARAQMPGMPVLQNAFTSPGFTVAVNYGGSSGGAYALGGAGAWAPSADGFQLSAGAGAYKAGTGATSAVTYGGRASLPVFHLLSDAMAIAIFGGIGGAHVNGLNETLAPIGVSVGYRHPLGATRALSVYAVPFYGWTHAQIAGTGGSATTTTNSGDLFGAIGADVTIMPQLGLSAGYQLGSRRGTKGVFGVALSYALSRGS
ncbi:MAG: hypothetical protein M3081_16195 [Gemmatimonadota bacterium]|nr:hypothetical protein [Gemmatimonadota bacterium]